MASEVSEAVARRFATLFAGHTEARGAMWMAANGVDKAKVKTLAEPVTDVTYTQHLAGTGPVLGVIPIRQDGTAYFGAIDLDDHSADLLALEAQVRALELPLVVCRSKSGGAHLYCFTQEAVSAATLIEALKTWRHALGKERNADGRRVEVFPKQASVEKLDSGNWINLPYYDHQHNELRYAINGDRRLSLEEFLDLAEAKAVSPARLSGAADPRLGPFATGPICLQVLHQEGMREGGRNTTLFNVALFFRARNEATWEAALRDYNDGLEAPLPERELEQIIRSVANHPDYCYTCDQQPLESVCQRRKCKQQPHGIEFFAKQRRLDSLPTLTNLVKVMTEPPRYRLKVNGTEVTCSTDELLSASLFKKIVAERLNVVITPPKPHEWDELVRELFTEITEEPAPLEAGEQGILLMLFDDFLEQHTKTEKLEDVMRGYPWRDPATRRIYFRIADLLAFLQRRNFSKRFEVNVIYQLLAQNHQLTFEHHHVKGALVSLWSVPEPPHRQREPYDQPASSTVSPY